MPGTRLLRGWARLRGPLATAAVLLACAGLAEAAGATAGQAGAGAPWRVVLMRGWDSLYPINLTREKALRETLADGAPRLIEFFPEEIDPLRFPGAIESDIVALLQRKYVDTPIDLVIASGNDALEFAARHRDAIWPNAAILFNGVFEGTQWHRPPRTAGVTMALDVEGTVDLGRALVPSARRLYVVSGSSAYDREILVVAMQKLARIEPPLEIHYLTGLTRGQASARVSALEKDDLVLYLTMLRDSDGQLSGPNAPALVQVASSSSVPVLSTIQTQYGRGVIGGSSPRYDLHGRAAGELARRILQGVDPDTIDVRTVPAATCEVDWYALRRWQVEEGNVPAACTLVNRPPDAPRTYLWQVVIAIAIIVVQAALLSVLLVQSRRRRIAQARLPARTADLAQESRISMIGALTANLAHEINQPMGAILSNAEAAQIMLEQGTLTPEKLREILNDIRADDLRASEVIRTLRGLFARSQWRPTAIEANTVVAEALRHVQFEAARRDVKLMPNYGSGMPAVLGDSVQLQQVVINLVVNAIEAVAHLAGIRREVRIETSVVSNGVAIAVADEGPGLSPEDAGRLFESTFTTKRESMGFGLSIVRSIVEMHRGRVWFEPNLPHGAVFHVWLPAIGS
jgi:signal transduction histidine kinase